MGFGLQGARVETSRGAGIHIRDNGQALWSCLVKMVKQPDTIKSLQVFQPFHEFRIYLHRTFNAICKMHLQEYPSHSDGVWMMPIGVN